MEKQEAKCCGTIKRRGRISSHGIHIKRAWIKHLLHDMKIECKGTMQMYCDNQAARHIASNPVFHERTKHIEVDCHFVRDKVQSGEIETPFVRSHEQLADIFTKCVDRVHLTKLQAR